MRPSSHQAAKLYATAKTHKFQDLGDITVEQLTVRPIMDQTNIMAYNTSQIMSKYLQPLAENEYIIKDTLKFPKFIRDNPINDNEEDVSYDVVSLFTNIPVSETIEFILTEIYDKKQLQPICSKLIMRRLLTKLSSECLFSFDGKLYRQQEGCAMGNPLSVVLANIHMARLEREVVHPEKPILYKRYVDDVFCRRLKGKEDTLFQKMNQHHPNIKLTVENELTTFLDTKLTLDHGIYETKVNRKNKLPTNWSSRIPKKIKRNAINSDLHRAREISSDFEQEVKIIREKFKNADYPVRFTESVINQFKNKPTEIPQIPDNLPPKPLIPIYLPYCEVNESISSNFIKTLNRYTGDKFRFTIMWNTKRIRSLFKIKDKTVHISSVIYQGICSCDTNVKYMGETKINAENRWAQHNTVNHNSNPAKHLKGNIEHSFNWSVICTAPRHQNRRKILEALFIAKYKPSLNEQIHHKALTLFKHGIT